MLYQMKYNFNTLRLFWESTILYAMTDQAAVMKDTIYRHSDLSSAGLTAEARNGISAAELGWLTPEYSLCIPWLQTWTTKTVFVAKIIPRANSCALFILLFMHGFLYLLLGVLVPKEGSMKARLT